MLGKIISTIENIFDPSSREPEIPYGQKFEDQFADKIEWIGIQDHNSGANFVSHRLEKVDSNTIKVKCTWEAMVLGLIIQFMGGTLAIFGTIVVWNDGRVPWYGSLIPLIPGLVFVVIGGNLLNQLLAPIIFDFREGVFKKGIEGIENHRKNLKSRDCFSLKEIHAIQLLCYLKHSRHPFQCFQLNLVLKDRSRITILDHSGSLVIRNEAESLASMLNVPIWDVM